MTALGDTSALVTGGASGIGAEVFRMLAARGAHVVIGDLQVDRGQELADQIGGTFVCCDVTDPHQVAVLVSAAVGQAPLFRVVHAAGRGWTERTVDQVGASCSVHDLASFSRVLAVNLVGGFDVFRRCAEAMVGNTPDAAGERGAILSISSVEAYDGQAGQVAYSAAKAGLAGMTLPLARDLAPFGIRVNTLAPGFVDTPIYGDDEASQAYKSRLGAEVLFPQRLGRVDEVAALAMACLDNTYLNAETVRLDGGIRMRPVLPAR
jgi:NAD(P)-dependent dehydrogenase (short-subunit alcohol dehydrogenase family)